jgi:hypothetical protein
MHLTMCRDDRTVCLVPKMNTRPRAPTRTPYHLRLSKEERAALKRLARVAKLNGADLLRKLIADADAIACLDTSHH